MPAVVVLPLLPPHPTSIRPTLGTLRPVRNLYSTVFGRAVTLPFSSLTSVDWYWYVDSM